VGLNRKIFLTSNQHFIRSACMYWMQDRDCFCRVQWTSVPHRSGLLISGTIPLSRISSRLCVMLLLG